MAILVSQFSVYCAVSYGSNDLVFLPSLELFQYIKLESRLSIVKLYINDIVIRLYWQRNKKYALNVNIMQKDVNYKERQILKAERVLFFKIPTIILFCSKATVLI